MDRETLDKVPVNIGVLQNIEIPIQTDMIISANTPKFDERRSPRFSEILNDEVIYVNYGTIDDFVRQDMADISGN